MKVSLINCQQSGPPYLPLGLSYIASSIYKQHTVNLIDLSFCSRDYGKVVLNVIKKNIPDVVAFSVNSSNVNYVKKIARLLKQKYPAILIVFGGIYPTLLPEIIMQCPEVDAICIGEGERSFLDYLNKLDQNNELLIPGIWYRKGNKEIVKNRLRQFESNIDNIPFPDRKIFDISKYVKTSFFSSLPFEASRGCLYNCSFCSSPVIRNNFPGRYFRMHSPMYIIEEIEAAAVDFWNKGFRCVDFADDNFGLDMNWFYNFCSLYKKSKLHKKINWFCHIRADKITDEWANLAANAGCVMVGIGVESWDEEIRRRIYNKEITNKKIEEALSCLRKYKIVPLIYMIVGCYEENMSTIKKSLNFVKTASPSITHFFYCQPFPRTKLAHDIQRKTGFSDEIRLIQNWNEKNVRLLYLNTKILRKITIKIQRKNLVKELYKTICIGRGHFFFDCIKFILVFKGYLLHSFGYKLTKNFIHINYSKYILKQTKYSHEKR